MYLLIDSLEAGGAERNSAALASYLADKGWSVTIVTIKPIESDFYRVGVNVRRLSIGLPSSGGLVRRVSINVRRVVALRRRLQEDVPYAIVGMMTACSVLAIMAALGTPVRVVVSERNNPLRKETRAVWIWLRKHFYRLADAHVAQTNDTASWLTDSTGARNVQVIANAVSWPLTQVGPVQDPQRWLHPNDRCILAAGTKWHQKGFDLLIDAFAHAVSSNLAWKLVIVGVERSAGEGMEPVKILSQRAQSLGVGDRVHLPGMIGNMPDWYARADIFVLSSRYEGYPNVLMEAMASGCACTAFDCDTGPREIITHNDDGLLVPPEDSTGLADSIKRLADDEALRKRLSIKAKEVRERYSAQRIYGQWSSLLAGLGANGVGGDRGGPRPSGGDAERPS